MWFEWHRGGQVANAMLLMWSIWHEKNNWTSVGEQRSYGNGAFFIVAGKRVPYFRL